MCRLKIDDRKRLGKSIDQLTSVSNGFEEGLQTGINQGLEQGIEQGMKASATHCPPIAGKWYATTTDTTAYRPGNMLPYQY